MLALYIIVFLANVIFDITSVTLLPSHVATRFSAGGEPDTWGSPREYIQAMVAIKTLFFILFLLMPRLIAVMPPQFVNLPNREYWLAPERISVAQRRLARRIHAIGSALFLFLLAMSLLVVQANNRIPPRLDERAALAALVVFLGFAIFWIIALFRCFRRTNPRHPHERAAG